MDTNILIQAFKDSLLSKVSSDGFGQACLVHGASLPMGIEAAGNDGISFCMSHPLYRVSLSIGLEA